MLKKFFNFDFERKLAAELCANFSRRLPPNDLAQGTNSKTTIKKVARAMEEMCQEATRCNGSRRIGIVRRSVLANNLKWCLKDAGYNEDFVNEATESLVFTLTKNPSH